MVDPRAESPLAACIARAPARAREDPAAALAALLAELLAIAAAAPEEALEFLDAPHRHDPGALERYQRALEGLGEAVGRLRALRPPGSPQPPRLEEGLAGGFFFLLRRALLAGADPRGLFADSLAFWLIEMLDEEGAARLRAELCSG